MNTDEKLNKKMGRVKNKFRVISGKGGVGKSTVSVNLAYSLSSKGYKVGLVDIDIHGPNIIKMMGLEKEKITGDEGDINPIKVSDNLKVISTASILEDPDTPVIWRGPLKMKLIRQFLEDVNWGDLDFLIIDSPPGTGDEPLSIAQLIKDVTGAIIVTTPQDVAVLDARKSVSFAQKLNIPYIGVIENMSGLICPHCGKEIDLFKKGGGERAAWEMKVDFITSIPFETDMVKLSDDGKVFLKYKDSSTINEKFKEIVEKIEKVSNINNEG